ncbi:glycosyltransferase family protein [Jiella marina]|uniref:hypothetical protein n=1 Tax=Jiella sp. LLJ827 TaxID=2917712 RepID=UPI0021012F09|nr:hypothetical protein [Jiella sp. LLJ827]MCQ0990285.1 hypothetical protein [Jiella sp. LLJ827]
MTAPVLIEGRNLAIKQGTGIASYARNLTQVLRGQGHELDVLFDTEFPLTPNQPEWNEIKLYDPSAGNRSIFARFRRFRRAGQYMAAAPFGVTASEIACTHGESDSLFPDLQGFARQQAVEMLFLRADWHVQRYGRRLAVKPLRQPKLMHATHPAAIEVKGCPNIYTVHDLVPLRLPHTTLDNKRAFLRP